MDNKQAKFCAGTGKYHTDKPVDGKIQHPLYDVTWEFITRQTQNPIDCAKSKGNWVIPSNLKSRQKSNQIELGEFHLLTLDIDENPPSLRSVANKLAVVVGAYASVIYTTKSATQDYPKSRALVRITPSDYVTWYVAQNVFYSKLAQHGINADTALLEPQQIIFLPNLGEFYDYRIIQGGLFDPVAAWRNEMVEFWKENFKSKPTPEPKGMHPTTTVNFDQNGTISGLDAIRLFNNQYQISDILIQAGYAEKHGEFRHPNSNSGSYSVSIKDGKAHSLSPNDPLHLLHGGGRDAFDCFRVLFHGGSRRDALIDACGSWLFVDGVSVTNHNQAIYLAEKQGWAA